MDPQPEPGTGSGDSTRSSNVIFKGKIVQVLITDDAQEEFDRLSTIVQEERGKGILQSDHQILFHSIQQKLSLLRVDPGYGIHIAKRQMPREYVQKYKIKNIWKINLAGAWRMLYTIRSTEIEVLAVVLDILDHRTYEKKFGYRKS